MTSLRELLDRLLGRTTPPEPKPEEPLPPREELTDERQSELLRKRDEYIERGGDDSDLEQV